MNLLPGSGARVLSLSLSLSLSLLLTVPTLLLSSGVAGAQSCGPAPQGRVAVMAVVDAGTGAPSQRCVEVGERSTGYDVLGAAGHVLRIESGFLCAIDGVPATGCGNRPDFDGAYWRYFHAAPGGDWTYSNVGGGGYRMPARCAVEGWRFATSTAEVIAPQVSPPQVTCEAPAATVPAVPTPAPAAGTPGGDGSVDGDSVGGGAVGGGAAGAPDAGGVSGQADGTGAQPGSAPPSTMVPPPDGSGATTAPATTAPDASVSAEVANGGATRSEDGDGGSREDATGQRAASSDSPGTGSSPVGLLVGLVVIAGLGLGAWLRSHRRSPVAVAEIPAEGP